MSFEDAFRHADIAIQQIRPEGEGLRDIERIVLEGSWHKKTYEAIADEADYSPGYLSRDVGPTLWKDLSAALGTNVSKKNFRTAIERWVHQNPTPPPTLPEIAPRVSTLSADWGALRMDVSDFRGRGDDIEFLSTLVLQERCRLIGLVGIPGVGKTWLAVKLAHHLQSEFHQVIYLSLRDRPDPRALATELLIGLGAPPEADSALEPLCSALIHQLDQFSYLLVLDDGDQLYQAGELSGTYPASLQGYELFLQALSTQSHRSCLLWVGREWPRTLTAMGRSRRYIVRGMTSEDVSQLSCWPRLLKADIDQWQALHQWLGGVPPLMPPLVDRLKFVAYDLERCLDHGGTPIAGINQYFANWLSVLSDHEQSVLTELALAHQPKSLQQLLTPLVPETLFAVVDSLCDRGFCRLRVEDSQITLALPQALRPYLCDRWIRGLSMQLPEQLVSVLHAYPLVQVDAPEPVQQQQRQQVLQPLAEHLGDALPESQDRLEWLTPQLSHSRPLGRQQPGFSAGNLLNLAQHWRLPLVELDCRDLILWGTDLQSDAWQGIDLSGSDLDQTLLAKPLGRQPVMAIDPHYKAVAVGDQAGQLLLWRPQDGRLQPGPEFDQLSPVLAVALDPQGRNLAVGRQDGLVQLWTLGSNYGPEILTPEAIPPLRVLTYSPDGQCLAGGTITGLLYLWRLDSGECLQQISAHTGPITAIAFSPCGQWLTTAGQDGHAVEWERTTGRARYRFQGRVTAWLGTVGYRPRQDPDAPHQAITIGRDEGQVLLWDLASHRPYRVLVERCDTVITAALSPNGQYLALSDIQQTVRIWSVATRQLCHCLPAFQAPVTGLVFSPDSTLLITGSDYNVQLWSLATGECWRSWQSQRHSVTALALTAETQILSLHQDQTLRYWRPASAGRWRPQRRLRLGASTVSALAVGGSGHYWVTGDDQGRIQLCNPHGHDAFREPLKLPGAITALALDNPETWLAAADSVGTLALWHLPSQICQWQHQGEGEPLTTLVFSPEGDRLFGGSRDRTIQSWTLEGEPIAQLTGHLRQVHCLWPLPKGQQLLSGSKYGTVCLWDLDRQEIQHRWQPLDRLIYGVTADLQGNPLAIAGSAQTLEVWEIGKDRHRCTLTDEGSTLWHVSLSPDGQHLLSASQEGNLNLWRVATGEHLAQLRVDRPYEAMKIKGCTGLSPVERSILHTLGAID